MLAGDDDVYYACDKCKAKTAATVYMRIHRFPRVLQLHIKRFKYAGLRTAQTHCLSSVAGSVGAVSYQHSLRAFGICHAVEAGPFDSQHMPSVPAHPDPFHSCGM